MNKIVNLTPHPINIIEGAEMNVQTKHWFGGKVVKTIPSSGVARLQTRDVVTYKIEDIPVFKSEIISVDELPNDVDIIIVSALFASKVDDPRLYVPFGTVYDETDTKIVGCLGLTKVK